MVTAANAAAAAWAADGAIIAVAAHLTTALSWWGRAAAMVARDGPTVALFLWAVFGILLPPGAQAARGARLRGALAAVYVGVAWSVAWAVFGWTPPFARFTFGAAAASQAAASVLPIGGAVLALAAGSRSGWGRGRLLWLVAWGYVLARVAIGADGPLLALGQVVSAYVAVSLVRHIDALRTWVQGVADAWARSLGLSPPEPDIP